MSNTIQIKRGVGEPPTGALAPYELGYDTQNGTLYIGGQPQGNQYGSANSVNAKGAFTLINEQGEVYDAGSSTIPVYLEDGIIKPCSSGEVSLGVSVESASKLVTPKEFKVKLDKTGAVLFDGTANVTLGTEGILPITKGGTGASTPDAARTSLGLSNNDFKTKMLEIVYPIGSIYMSTTNNSPATFLGGTWERITERFLYAAADSGTYTINKTGGATTVTLTEANLPAHSHSGLYYTNDSGVTKPISLNSGSAGYELEWTANKSANDARIFTGETGSGTAHSNMPPYLTVYMWKRTA